MSVLSNNTLAGSSGQGGGGYEIERSLRFNSGDSSYLNRTPSSAGNRKTWTWSGWVKLSKVDGSEQNLFSSTATGNGAIRLNNSILQVRFGSSYGTTSAFRDPSSWYHVVVSCDTTQATAADRIKLYVNGTLQPLSGYPSQNFDGAINNNVEHRIGAQTGNTSYMFNGYLADIHFIDGQALAATDFGKYDDNVWQPKKYSGSYGTNGFHLDFSDTSSNAALGTDTSGNSNTWTVNNLTAASGIGPGITSTVPENLTGNWRGIIGIVPSGTSGAVAVFPDGGGTAQSRGTFYWTGLTIGDTITWYGTSSGSTRSVVGNVNETSVSVPGGSLGSFQLTVSAASGSAKVDFNGTANCYGITPGPVSSEYNDALRDSPTNGTQTDTGVGGEVVGNYATLNPLDNGGSLTLTNGNLDAEGNANHNAARGTFKFPSTGKWYFEGTVQSPFSGTTANCIGVATDLAANPNISATGTYLILVNNSGGVQRYVNGTPTTASGFSAAAIGSVMQVAYDADSQHLWLGLNNVWMDGSVGTTGNPTSGANPTVTGVSDVFPATNQYSTKVSLNFGQRSWAYAAPTNYKALCTANLPDPTIADGSTAFDTKLYTGNGSTQTISGMNMSPDLIWSKIRSSTGKHRLTDSVRGTANALRSDGTDAEFADTNVTAFNSDGFDIGANGNASGSTYVAWAWDAGSSNTTIAAGGLNSSVYNMSEVWSDDLYTANGPSDAPTVTTQSFLSGYPATNPFNGNGNGAHETYAADSHKTIVFRPDTALTGVTKLEYYTNGTYASDVGYNSATSVITGNTTTGWQTLYEGTAITVNYVWAYKNNGQGSFTGVKVNGRMLVDSGVTPPTSVPSIASTVRANPSAGFSIVKYNGVGNATVAHGLNAAPEFFFGRNLDDTSGGLDWIIYHKSIGNTGRLKFNANATSVSSTFFQDTTPTSSVITIGTSNDISKSGDDYILYCFAPVEGYSAFGSYVGNGESSEGPFIYLGFKPELLILKGSDGFAKNWHMWDSTRNPNNVTNLSLYPSTSGAEGNVTIDFLSNGFKPRTSNGEVNSSGATYVYAAFAEHPFKNSRAH